MPALFSLWNSIQQYLIQYIEENIGGLTEKKSGFVCIDSQGRMEFTGDSVIGRVFEIQPGSKAAMRLGALWAFPQSRYFPGSSPSSAKGGYRALCMKAWCRHT